MRGSGEVTVAPEEPPPSTAESRQLERIKLSMVKRFKVSRSIDIPDNL